MEKVFVAECRLGRGLFAEVPLKRGEVILTFAGQVLSLREVMGRPDSFNMLQIGRGEYLDLESPGLYGNHSCEPNAGLRDNTTLVAMRDILAGEEIQYDYSTTMSEDLETMECRCCTRSCRGVVRDFRYLPPEVRHRYLSLGLVPDFILEEQTVPLPLFAEEGLAGS
ncbi:SET domain-containing protein [Melittangium boletus]|uniref:SET domain-containing protein-lysine N-methyltransferase n=1 Tax=Melittangium boletus DSM 14713 TaxID=1294270 RepID=A0A250IFJ5_9BACT|nr:SET domain-containing protein-lysine N-methyltransferase [Melittangium boletus]ATB29942.1 SET domain-containing protein-lysine N-methyltransferase [Melittangium boletus DSM 14713]